MQTVCTRPLLGGEGPGDKANYGIYTQVYCTGGIAVCMAIAPFVGLWHLFVLKVKSNQNNLHDEKVWLVDYP